MRRLLLATNNPGKAREFIRLLAPFGIRCLTPAEAGVELDVPEDGSTYSENASAKARAFADASGLVSLADDSGLEVDALAGKPGLRSARFGGPGLDATGRNELLLSSLAGVQPADRTARYRAVVAVAAPDSSDVKLFEGVQEGTIATEIRGIRGFGYDPVFLVDGRRTEAEIPEAEKDRISHRGHACRLAGEYLERLL
ncbi:MAG: RdgB/HAM1 family non-canonical purine NTP pyrophosphatase [Dehalococcoidia bacterium]